MPLEKSWHAIVKAQRRDIGAGGALVAKRLGGENGTYVRMRSPKPDVSTVDRRMISRCEKGPQIG